MIIEVVIVALVVSLITAVVTSLIAVAHKYRVDANRIKDKIAEDIRSMKQALDTFSLKDMNDRIIKLEGQIGANLIMSQSPLTLTKEGHNMVVKSGMQKYIDNNIDRFRDIFKSYDNEAYIYDVALSLAKQYLDPRNSRDDREIGSIKLALYKEGVHPNIMNELFALYLKEAVMLSKKN